MVDAAEKERALGDTRRTSIKLIEVSTVFRSYAHYNEQVSLSQETVIIERVLVF